MDDERVEASDRDEGPATAAEVGDAEPPPQPEPVAEPIAGNAVPAGSATADETPPPPGPRRGLKLVVWLRPEGAADYRAVLALGADGCDPLLRSAGVSDLQAALDEVPGLLAEAEARWAGQPRNPAARPARAARGAPRQRPPTAPPAPALANPATAESAPPAADPHEPAPAGQLSLFG